MLIKNQGAIYFIYDFIYIPAKAIMPIQPKISICADNMLVADYGNHSESNRAVQRLYQYLCNKKSPHIQEIIAGMHTLALILPPPLCNHGGRLKAITYLQSVTSHDFLAPPIQNTIIHLPVCYAKELAPDLDRISRHTQLGTREIIRIHLQGSYQAQLIGFMPGFAYLSGLDKQLITPRLDKPRERVPKGSVGIAGEQCAVYPNPTPGGWNLIGASPSTLFNPDHTPQCLINLGDEVVFEEISKSRFERLCKN